jgi:predicted ATPase/DNA-binding winged helix-turn-helix (wHTH) protein
MTPSTAAAPLRFGRFELQAHERRLLVDGRAAVLGARAFDLLLALAERSGRLVDKATLMELVWPGVVVQENNLAAQMSALRKVLGDEVIATVPGRGYRFVAHVESSAAMAAPAPAAAQPPALRTNLPGELPVLLGRSSELAVLGALIDRHRLVSVIGAGGIGKSLLTQHVLAARRGAYAHGVCWIELGAVNDASALPGAVAAALGVDGGHGDALAALVSAVSSLTMLLALDNAEHLLADVAALCRALHDAAPGLRLVVTSQAPLRLVAEQVLRIDPLAVPEAVLPAGDALRFGAVALFAERARAVDRRFEVTDVTVADVIETCRALDGLPLAIELAAARAPLLGVPRLRASLQDRFALLTQGRNRAAPERQRTLRAALEWSHALLGEREQRVFRQLGVMAGSASLALVLQVLADDASLDRWALLDALDTLVDRSLVALVAAPHDDEPRYRLLETPRAFAFECLDAAGERAALQRRHAVAVAAMFDAAYEVYFTGREGVEDWLHRREAELDNARDALHWARGAGDADVALRIGATMLRALPPSLHVERMALADACQAQLSPALPERLQLQVWVELSCVLADSQKARGRHAADQALALARQMDPAQPDRFMLYHALCRAASAAAQTNDLALTRALLDEAQRIEDPSWPAQRLLWGAEAAQWLARMSHDTAAALRLGRRMLALDRERGSHAAIATGNLIDAELAAGDPVAAARSGFALVESLLGTRHEFSLAFARINLLAALLATDDVARARPVAQAAWAKASAFDLQHAAAAYLALLCALEGRPRAAARLAAYSEAIYAARSEAREHNETTATLRAQALASRKLEDAATLARLRVEGAALRDADVPVLAFSIEDA